MSSWPSASTCAAAVVGAAGAAANSGNSAKTASRAPSGSRANKSIRYSTLSERMSVMLARTVANAAAAVTAVPAWATAGASVSVWSSASEASISGRGLLFCVELLSCRRILWLNREVTGYQ